MQRQDAGHIEKLCEMQGISAGDAENMYTNIEQLTVGQLITWWVTSNVARLGENITLKVCNVKNINKNMI